MDSENMVAVTLAIVVRVPPMWCHGFWRSWYQTTLLVGAKSCYNLVSTPMAGARTVCITWFLCPWQGQTVCWLSFSVFVGVGYLVLCFWTWTNDIIGQTESTLLDILINHWREVRERGENLSVVVKKDKLVSSSEWPTFRLGRPPVGTFNLEVIKVVEESL